VAPRIYFAGVNTNPLCEAFAGLHVLESFADIRGLMDRHRPGFASMCLDSGAYSVMSSGVTIDLREYIAFAKRHGGAYDFVASLDAITGGVKENFDNLNAMRAAGIDAMPTFHSGESLEVLKVYCKASSRLGIGMKRPNGKFPPAPEVRKFLSDCFAVIPPTVKVHGWGMTSFTDFPFWSVDSTTWLWEARALMALSVRNQADGLAGQGAEALACLTPTELIQIVQKKHLRFAKRQTWEGWT
jgi:hypothetical protein